MASYGSADNVSLPQQRYTFLHSVAALLESPAAMFSLVSPPLATGMPTLEMLLLPIILATLATMALLPTTLTPWLPPKSASERMRLAMPVSTTTVCQALPMWE